MQLYYKSDVSERNFNLLYGTIGMLCAGAAGAYLGETLNTHIDTFKQAHYAIQAFVETATTVGVGAMGLFVGGFAEEGLRIYRSRRTLEHELIDAREPK